MKNIKQLILPNGETISYIDKLTAIDIYEEIYVENDYLKYGVQVKDNDVIFDVGANIGLFSRFLTTKAQNLKIFTFEPIPIAFEALEENLKNLPAQIENYNIGLGESSKITKIHYYPKVSADSAIVEFDWDYKINKHLENYNETVVSWIPKAKYVPKFLRRFVLKAALKRLYKAELLDCKIRTISEIIEENYIEVINLLKIDAENYESQVLAGISDNDWEKIQQISMEVHGHIQGGENLLNKLTKMLETKGFQVIKETDSRFSLMNVNMLYAIKK